MDKVETIKIDPKMFISAPYDQCPNCKKSDTFGVSNSIGKDKYTKKCTDCFYSDSFSLPKLNKKVIYVDQFAISDMMKAINKEYGRADKINGVFLQLFSELDSLVKAQLILCPDSEFHREESMLFPGFKALKRMYEHLSNATTFYDPYTIKRFQISEGFKKWLKKKNTKITKFEVDSIIHGDRNEWQDKWLITVDFKIQQKEVDDYRNSRTKISKQFEELFEEWKKEKKTFKEFYAKASSAYGPLIIRKYLEMMAKMLQARINNTELSTEEFISLVMGQPNTLITNLMHYLPDSQREDQKLQTIASYLKSPEFNMLPFNVIASALWSAIEYQASTGGRQNPPNVGMMNDIDMISILLPYCDAMIVDRDMYSILNFGPVKKILKNYPAKVFSLSNKTELFDYLEKIKKGASKNHFKLIEKIYGKGWDQPFYELYE